MFVAPIWNSIPKTILRRIKMKALYFLLVCLVCTLSAFVNAQEKPSDAGSCFVWKQQQFRPRVWQAVAEWTKVPAANLRSTATLRELAITGKSSADNPFVGPGGMAIDMRAQNELIKTINNVNTFAPFNSKFTTLVSEVGPTTLQTTIVNGEKVGAIDFDHTTVSDFEKIVWALQLPRTDCWGTP
jgi:hypothetical protein